MAEEYPNNQRKEISDHKFGALGTEINPPEKEERRMTPLISKCQPKEMKILEEKWRRRS